MGSVERELREFVWGEGLGGLSDLAVELYQYAHLDMWLRRRIKGLTVEEIASEAIECAAYFEL